MGHRHLTRLIAEALSQQEAADRSNEISGEIQNEVVEELEASSNPLSDTRHQAVIE